MPDAVGPLGPCPRIARLGLTGLLVTFADTLSEPANRAALAMRAAVEAAAWPGVAETATSLTSVFVRIDPLGTDPNDIEDRLRDLLDSTDWTAAALPDGRRLWTIPCCFDGDHAPQLDEAAQLAGLDRIQAIREIAAARTRVLTIGFAPGQPYLGTLPEHWDIPRQTALTPRVPVGALVCAIRQLIVFSAPSQTGWRQIGQTAFRGFRPETEAPFALRAGDELVFEPTNAQGLIAAEGDPDGGARVEDLS